MTEAIEENNRKKELGNENIGRLLIRYSTPAAVGMIVNSLYNLVDTIFIGRGAGTMALAGLAISFPIMMVLMAVAMTVGLGSASIISRSLGAGDDRKADMVAGNSFALITVLSLIMTILGLIYLEPVILLFGATEAVLPYASQYMTIILWGSFLFCFTISGNNLIRSEGNAKTAMYSMIIGTGTNLVLDPIFIFVFRMGIRGAAIATVISFFVSFLYIVLYFRSGKSMLSITKENLRLNWAISAEVMEIGAPSFARTIAGSLMAIAVFRSISHYGQDIHIAILGVCNRVVMFTMMPLFGIIQGLQPIVGFNYGAKKMKRVKDSLNLAVRAATLLVTLNWILMLIFTRQIISMFTDDPHLILEAVPLFRSMIIALPVVGFQMVGASFFQAIGKAWPALFLTMSREILFRIPAVLIVPIFYKLVGIWMSFPVSDVLSTIVTFIFLNNEIKILNREISNKVPIAPVPEPV